MKYSKVQKSDQGAMYVAGMISQDDHYKSTKQDKEEKQHDLFRAIHDLFYKNGFKEVATEMQKQVNDRKLPPLLGDDMAALFSDCFGMSENYYKNNHADVNDGHCCVTMWTYQNGNSEGIKGAHLVFPDILMTYIDESGKEVTKALAIHLVSGMPIEWDGRVLCH